MYGAIIGDIVGSIYERASKKTKEFPLFTPKSRATDDSIMTIAVADALIGIIKDSRPEPDAEDKDTNPSRGAGIWPTDAEIKRRFAQSMKLWGNKYPRAGYGGNFSSWLTSTSSEPYNSFGNGSAMRVSACGWFFDDIETIRHIARLSAEVTHNHPEGIKGAESIAAAIFMARKGKSKEAIKDYIVQEFGYDLDRTCDEIRPGYAFDVSCQGSVPEAIIAFLEGESYEDVIRNAISLGGDTDTQGAIAGSIAEAFFGIPDEIIEGAKAYIDEDMQNIIDEFYRLRQES